MADSVEFQRSQGVEIEEFFATIDALISDISVSQGLLTGATLGRE